MANYLKDNKKSTLKGEKNYFKNVIYALLPYFFRPDLYHFLLVLKCG